jgi:hypothetical protein
VLSGSWVSDGKKTTFKLEKQDAALFDCHHVIKMKKGLIVGTSHIAEEEKNIYFVDADISTIHDAKYGMEGRILIYMT